jgi:hypothetical protein
MHAMIQQKEQVYGIIWKKDKRAEIGTSSDPGVSE